jgi:hypothetical protein
MFFVKLKPVLNNKDVQDVEYLQQCKNRFEPSKHKGTLHKYQSKSLDNWCQNEIGLTRLIGLNRTDSIKTRQDRSLIRRNEGVVKRKDDNARKTGSNLGEMKAELRANNKNCEVL